MSEVARNMNDDSATRRRALDVSRSFIVQAPAGSGKTELLTQRFLRLLATVDKPEEILAMTFTRKAAGEMRDRILSALADAKKAIAIDEAHRKTTRELALAALARDHEQGWNLLEYPSRLRITTIDGFNATLAQTMPLSAGSGLPTAISADPRVLYEEAALRQMRHVDDGPDTPEASLLAHLDNRLGRCIDLLAEALSARDMWLETVVTARATERLREYLEASLDRQVRHQIREIRDLLGSSDLDRIKIWLAAAVENNSDLLSGQSERDFTEADDAPWFWQLVAKTLLKSNGPSWRTRVDARQGFPPQDPHKSEVTEYLAGLEDGDALSAALDELRLMPAVAYPEGQWRILEQLLTVLPRCAAQLQLVFMERGEVDYAAISHAALTALGMPEAPSDLALALDYRIHHILIDEFQDTSRSQLGLLNLLTQGWEEGDGRSLLLVGDPMQSVYRFRKAEVALFLDCQERGLDGGRLRLEPLTLSANFRSQRGLVDWCNSTFAVLMAGTQNLAAGMVGFNASASVFKKLAGDAVTIWPQSVDDRYAEANDIATIAQQALAASLEHTVAILVRARSHLSEVIPALRRAGLRFRTIDTERLDQRQVIQDLLAVTRAVLHPADRAAWLAMLRAPWCGMSLRDLTALLGTAKNETIPELLMDADFDTVELSEEGRLRLSRVAPALLYVRAQRGRRRLRETVEGLWLALGGAAILNDAADLDNAESYFALLEKHDRAGEPITLGAIERQLDNLYAAPDPQGDPRLQVMTVYAAKGLEFDTVIVAGLGRFIRDTGQPLLRWANVVDDADGRDSLLMAPLSATGDDSDPFFAYLKRLSRQRDLYESDRLLYVACTRARKRLHLLGHAAVSKKLDEPRAAAGSLLHRLWPVIGSKYLASPSDRVTLSPMENDTGAVVLQRLPADWRPPKPSRLEKIPLPLASHDTGASIEFDWVKEALRLIGTVVHRELESIGTDGLALWDEKRIVSRRQWWQTSLLAQGLPETSLQDSVSAIEQALLQTIADQRGRWILDSAHTDAHCEWALTGIDDGREVGVVLDRSFVDSNGVRWIIDYKTSRHEGSDLVAFVAEQRRRYTPQLERYARLIASLEHRPQRLGLYFPLLRQWVEWTPESTSAKAAR